MYDNFSAGVVMAIIEHGFCTPEEAGEVLTFDNLIAPEGKLPLTTSGGHFGEAYIQAMQMHVEAVRQLRGTSPNQVPGAQVCLSAGGPMTPVGTSVIFGGKDTVGRFVFGPRGCPFRSPRPMVSMRLSTRGSPSTGSSF